MALEGGEFLHGTCIPDHDGVERIAMCGDKFVGGRREDHIAYL